MSNGFPHPSCYSVSSLTRVLKDLLEAGFSDITVEGELSGVKMAPSGHLYFTLKDDSAIINGAFFKAKERGLTFNPSDGDQVRISGRITVYEPRGQYQLTAATMTQAGQGALLARLEELKKKLAAEGLFNPDRKRPIPPYPKTVVIITSAGAAALADMLRVFHSHQVPFRVRVLPVLVQGSEAPGQIAKMIHYAGRHGLGDVMIVGRGGGSLEDLSAFSSEEVVRAIAGCPIPTISAVGHEIDTPLSDFAADLRAVTPTKAAEILAGPWINLQENLTEANANLERLIRQRLEQAKLLIKPFTGDNLSQSIERILQPIRQRLDDGKESLIDNLKDRILDTSQRLKILKTEVEARSPQMLLDKGWSLVTTLEGQVITDPAQTPTGSRVHVRLAKGRITAEVKEINHAQEK